MVKPKRLKIKWDKKAQGDLRFIYEYIKLDSPKSARKVLNEILSLVNSLYKFPFKFPSEPLLSEEGNFRYAVKWSYKIIYEVTDEEIVVTYIFHTRQNPDKLT